MKKYIATLVGLLSLVGCGEMNELHQIYLDRGETIYTGAVDSLEVYGGMNRVQLKWEMNADPRIEDLVIRWNNRADSVILPVDRSNPEKVGIYRDSLILDQNLTEGSILFQLYTRDGLGHTSVIREVTGEVYGESFAASAALKLPRKIETVQTVSTNSVKLVFAEVDQPTMLSTKVLYISEGNEMVVDVPNEETEVLLENIHLGDVIQYQSMFLPNEDALDAFPGKMYTYTLPDMVLPSVGDTWETLDGSWYSYDGDPVPLVGAGRFLEKATGDAAIDDGENCYSTNLALEPNSNWRIGLKINKEDYSIKVYMAKLNPDWANNFRHCNYTPEKCYFDPDTGIIHFDYEVYVEGAWTIRGEVHMKFTSSEE